VLRSRQAFRLRRSRSAFRFDQRRSRPEVKVPRQCCSPRSRPCRQARRVESSGRSTGNGRRRYRCALRAVVVSHWMKAIQSFQFDLLAESWPHHEALLRLLQTLRHDHASSAILRLGLDDFRLPKRCSGFSMNARPCRWIAGSDSQHIGKQTETHTGSRAMIITRSPPAVDHQPSA
jgi:hypothetical protein